jgi:GLPGLI family protein
MKKFFTVLCVFFLTGTLFAQKKSGTVIYDVAQLHLDYKGTNLDVINMRKMAMKQQYNLTFNEHYSSFKLKEMLRDENFDESANSSAQTYIAFYDYYFDYKALIILEDGGDGYLVEQKLDTLPWVITSETKDIGGYQCYKATYTFDFINARKKTVTRTITAWFAPSLPYSHGPKNYRGLPGLILELSDYNVTFLASSIQLFEKPIEVKIPSVKRISDEEYTKQLFNNFGDILKK